jgi:hypothetical protein
VRVGEHLNFDMSGPFDELFQVNGVISERAFRFPARSIQCSGQVLWGRDDAHPLAAAAGRGYVDDIIDPRDTRPALIDALESLQTKRDKNPPKKHGNIPL